MSPRRAGGAGEAPARLVVDPVACDGLAMCAHLAPGVIGTDPWGFPIVPVGPLSAGDRRAARAASAGCPRQALHLVVPAAPGERSRG